MLKNTESRSKRDVRLMMASIYSERSRKGIHSTHIRVVKYIKNQKDESQLAKPRYAHHAQAKTQYRSSIRNHTVEYLCNLVEPVVVPDPPQEKFRSKLHPSPTHQGEEHLFVTQLTTTNPKKPPSQSHRVQKQMNMNKEILRRLGLLSTQAKRELEIEKLQTRVLKIKKEAEAIPIFSKQALRIVTKQIQLNEKTAQQIHRCTTSASAASKMALGFQEHKMNELLSERHLFLSSQASRRNRPRTREAQTQIKDFYMGVAQMQLANKDEIKEQGQRLGTQIDEIKEGLWKCKKQLLDYNDEIEIALGDEIIGQVLDYKNINKIMK